MKIANGVRIGKVQEDQLFKSVTSYHTLPNSREKWLDFTTKNDIFLFVQAGVKLQIFSQKNYIRTLVIQALEYFCKEQEKLDWENRHFSRLEITIKQFSSVVELFTVIWNMKIFALNLLQIYFLLAKVPLVLVWIWRNSLQTFMSKKIGVMRDFFCPALSLAIENDNRKYWNASL